MVPGIDDAESWRFRAAPVDRRIMLFGNLGSTWPVNTGVLIQDGVAYFAAGIIDQDGNVTEMWGPTTFLWKREDGKWRIAYADSDHYPVNKP